VVVAERQWEDTYWTGIECEEVFVAARYRTAVTRAGNPNREFVIILFSIELVEYILSFPIPVVCRTHYTCHLSKQ
jgi:hypothetical protein